MRTLTILIILIAFSISSHSLTLESIQKDSNDLKKIGNEILNGKNFQTFDILIIYQIFDSILTENPNDREFYFKVFNKINENAKGEVAVEMDWKIKDFCSKFPNDFFTVSETELIDYARRIGELFRTEEEYPSKAAKEYIYNMIQITDKKYKKEMNLFSLELMNKVKSMK